MTGQMVLDLAYRTMFVVAMVSAPILITAVVMGVVVNLVQTVTQIKDMSLTFVPKAVAAAVVLGLATPWILNVLVGFCSEMFELIGQM